MEKFNNWVGSESVSVERLKKERRVLYFPPPLNMAAYHLKKAKGR